jgi:hypothetical protein
MYWEHGNIKKGNNLMQHCFSSDNETDGDACPCKEEIEKEEALALAKALEVSGTDPPTPKIPGLTPTEKEEVVTIRIQPDVCNHAYITFKS